MIEDIIIPPWKWYIYRHIYFNLANSPRITGSNCYNQIRLRFIFVRNWIASLISFVDRPYVPLVAASSFYVIAFLRGKSTPNLVLGVPF
jgi:hypothetical protein